MSLLNQKTINNPVKFTGIGLHSGKEVKVCVKPSEPNTGIIFKRVDLDKNNLVFPSFVNVSNTSLNTTISNDYGVKVSTIEHLMGALFGLGVDNAIVEINNEEVPILDGSAKEFIEKITSTGLKNSEEPIKIIKINKEINYSEGERFISIDLSPSSKITSLFILIIFIGILLTSNPVGIIFSINSFADPSKIGTSSLSISINALSIPSPNNAPIKCSIVETLIPNSFSIVVLSEVFVTFIKFG